ncbi:MAG: hypothetical protein V8R51_04085 [Clostridia bacterium]
MKTFYIEKLDKHRFNLYKMKIEKDNFKIYANLEKERNIIKVIKKLIKNGTTNVVLSKELCENRDLINAINSSGIDIFDGRWLEKYLVFEILDYVIKQIGLKKEEIEFAITTNEITDISIEIIRTLATQYRRLTVVTNHIEKLKKIEKEIYEKHGVLIVISNNQKKSLLRPRIILNLDFNKEVLNRYKINEKAIIINLEGNMKIESKRFNGININDYEIEVGKEEIVWRENAKKFKNKDLLEAIMYMKDSFNNIRNKISKNKISIKEVFGVNGKIERFS